MSEKAIIKKHWLYGDLKFKVDVQEEDNCGDCVHSIVCRMDKEHFCLNYDFGTSAGDPRTCNRCIHRFTRWADDKDKIPCFKCRFFKQV